MAKDGISIRGIYERSDAKVREQEGMPRVKGFLSDPFDTKVEIVENGVRYFVDVAEGQKTGFFLDQKYNRKAIWPLCPGAEVLDCFTHTGSFALNAGLAGARHVLGWTLRSWVWHRPGKTPPSTVFPTGWNFSARTCLRCCRSWKPRGRNLTL